MCHIGKWTAKESAALINQTDSMTPIFSLPWQTCENLCCRPCNISWWTIINAFLSAMGDSTRIKWSTSVQEQSRITFTVWYTFNPKIYYNLTKLLFRSEFMHYKSNVTMLTHKSQNTKIWILRRRWVEESGERDEDSGSTLRNRHPNARP